MTTAHEDDKLSLTDKDDVAHIEKATASPPLVNEVVEDPALEARLNRKFDIHILPWLFGIWYLSPPSYTLSVPQSCLTSPLPCHAPPPSTSR